jgi:hypothetical protein
MPTPILDPKFTPTAASAQAAKAESPLAGQLPAWNLVPAHTLLVRRRSAPTKPPQSSTGTPPPPRPASQAAVPAPTPVAAPSSCPRCGRQLESGSAFCTGCGSRI